MTGHHFHHSILRAYDARGIVGETLSHEDAYHLGRAYGTVAARGGAQRIAVGYDGRHSSPGFARELRRGLVECGLTALDIGCCPTPQVYFAVHTFDLGGGVMITGSHNPPSHNGFKFMLGKDSFFGDSLAALGPLAAKGDYINSNRGSEEKLDMQPAYIDALAEAFTPHEDRALTVVWDSGNGSAGDVMRALTARLPGTHHLMFADIDGDFPNHHPDPSIEVNLKDLKAKIHDTKAAIGLAFDGDGDRCGLVDDEGEVIWADQFMILLAQHVLADEPGSPIIADVKSSQTLFDSIAAMGGQPVMWKTGHSVIKSKMKELKSPLGGEMSGHIFFKHRWFGFDDGLYTAVRLLSIVTHMDGKLSDFRKSLPALHSTPELHYEIDEKEKFTTVDKIAQKLISEGADVCTIDGVRVREKGGWWLIRASNTQAILVARVEAESADIAERLRKRVEECLQATGIPLILRQH